MDNDRTNELRTRLINIYESLEKIKAANEEKINKAYDARRDKI